MASFALVHGASHGAWCWERLVPHLGGECLALDLPGRASRPADLSALELPDLANSAARDILAAGLTDVVLVGHSMGGLTVPAVAARLPRRVRHVVFVSCVVPPEGGTGIDDLPWWLKALTRRAMRSSHAYRRPTPRLARRLFCNDCDDEQTAFILERLGPEAVHLLTRPVTRRDLPPTLPLTYVKLLADKAIPPARQDRMAARLAGAKVVPLDSGHDAMVSHPAELAEVLNAAAEVT